MRITKNQLKRIIREERQKLLKEFGAPEKKQSGREKLNEGAREMGALLAAIDDLKDRHGQEYVIDTLKSLIGEMEDGQYDHMGYYQD